MFSATFSTSILRSFYFGVLQSLLVVTSMGTLPEHAGSKDGVVEFCLYNYTMASNFAAVGCTVLDLNCPSGKHIQIQSVSCGRSKTWLKVCDSRTPTNCTAAINCCKQREIGEPVFVTNEELQQLREKCNNKHTCTHKMDVVEKKSYIFDKHFCLVSYTCQFDTSSSNSGSSASVYSVAKPSSTLSYMYVTIFSETTENRTDEQSSSTTTDNLLDTETSVATIIVPAVTGFVVIAVITVILLWRQKWGKKPKRSSASKPELWNSDRASNKYETIDLSHAGKYSSKSGLEEMAGVVIENTYQNEKKDIPLKAKRDTAFKGCTNNTDQVPPTEMISEAEYNEIRFSNKIVEENQHNNLYDNMVVNNVKDVKTPPDMNEKGSQYSISSNIFYDAENLQTEDDEQPTCPYFILEKYDQYNHLHSQTFHKIYHDSSDQLEQENEYNKINFAKKNPQVDPNYGFLAHAVSDSTIQDDTYSHLNEETTRKPKTQTDYSHVEKKTHFQL